MPNSAINKELLAACRAGDRRAQRALYDHSLPRLRYLAERYLYEAEDRQDALQESYLRVFQHLDQFDADRGSFLTWAGRITINVCLKRNRRHGEHITAELATVVDEPVTTEPGPLKQLTDAELLDWLKRMPHAYFVAFNLHCVEGYEYQEVAELLSITPALARQRVTRARAWLRKDLDRGGNTPLTIKRREAAVVPLLLAIQAALYL